MVKVPKYGSLVVDLRDVGYIVKFCVVEVGARGLMSKSGDDVL